MVYTFYSYKGGVGRSMALVNIAELMYHAGLKVVMVDWDLEAPGLERFYKNYIKTSLSIPQHKGLIDLLLDYQHRVSHHNPQIPIEKFKLIENLEDYLFDLYGDKKLWLLPAGQRTDLAQYANSVKAFDWGDFYENWEGEIYFETLREELEAFADVILIDSRTGVTEMGGVCTYQLADVVILFCAPNQQNIEGTLGMLKNLVDNPELNIIRENRPLKTLVVPARVETTSEIIQLNQFRERFNQEFTKYILIHDQLKANDSKQFYIELEIPYYPGYAFDERIAIKESKSQYRAEKFEISYNKLLNLLISLTANESIITKKIPLTLPSRTDATVNETFIDSTVRDAPFGVMRPASPFYIERESDQIAWQHLQNGRARTMFIQAPRQMGKSSFITRLAYQAKASHVIAYINFEQIAEFTLSNTETFFIEFSGLISDALGLPDRVDEFWASKRRSNPVKCSRYLTDYVLASQQKPLILVLDEVERLFSCTFRNDFFGMLRAWHNDNIHMGQLIMLLSGSTEPSLFSTNSTQSPFNVAERISLKDFTLEQVQILNLKYNGLLNQEQVEAIYHLLGGQPFLTRLAWYKIALGQANVTDLLTNPLADNSPFNDHLTRYWQILLDLPELKTSLVQICQEKTHPEDKNFFRLIGSGLIKKQGRQVTMRNELYRRYFMERL